ncbi:hypothetical protein N7478_007238 [Penicillium angulare]|uniref:uncharacterized protein n=1 Tax=Penicillium angulare TaxID=116970 RepID=UPI002540B941|nr:uncharacterized protein N7478_007238 [Penicillium angulare]KAJ5281866.1 hypothetical protein N7478_007238 [Penicillium angulare]
MSWGYNASPGPDRKEQSLQNISEKLVLDLYKLREMTKALIFSDLEQERPASNLDIISASTRGVFFIDTIELGISTHGMETYLKSAEGSEQVNSITYKEAQWLLDALNQYISHSARHRNVYVTPRNGQEAIQKAETQFNSSYIVINSDHNNINKFDSAEDYGYVKIREELFAILQETAWTDDTHIQCVE